MRITIDDIARMAGVSKATVSRVLNNKPEGVGEETRNRVQRLIDELEYKPNLLARGIVTSKTKTIGVILPDITNPFFPALIKSVENRASENGYTVIFGNTDFSQEKEQNYISTFVAKRVDGVLLTSTVTSPGMIHERLKKYNVPCVLLDRVLQHMEYDAGVFVDNEYALFTSCEYLIGHGNQKILLLSGPKDISTSYERIQGYQAALAQYGIAFDRRLLYYGDYTMESGYNAILETVRAGIEFTSVLASNDSMAIGAMKALKELGRSIPDEIELIGFDNIPFSEMTDPPLSTVQQPTYEMGQVAVDLLLKLIDGCALEQTHVRLQPKLILRGTTRRERMRYNEANSGGGKLEH